MTLHVVYREHVASVRNLSEQVIQKKKLICRPPAYHTEGLQEMVNRSEQEIGPFP